ncbi:hypothetical protein CP532_2409, partial [Ophiocordyceps camponoti-leonardi (nom. inval.)]
RHRLALPRILFPLRAMASSTSVAASTHEFLVIIPDKPGTQAKRKQIRPTHLERIKPKIDAGIFKMGGSLSPSPIPAHVFCALLNSIPADDDPSSLDFAGSALVCRAQSEHHARSLLAEDIYSSEGVWDLEKVVLACQRQDIVPAHLLTPLSQAHIYPFKCVFRNP